MARLMFKQTDPLFNGENVVGYRSTALAAIGLSNTTLSSLIECEFEGIPLIYSDTVKAAAGILNVIDKWYPTAAKIFETLNYTYDPIENYNLTETGNDSTTGTETTTHTGTDTNTRTDNITHNLTHGETITASGTVTTENSVAAYDSSSYSPANKSVESPADVSTHAGTDSTTQTGTVTDAFLRNTTDTLTHNHGVSHGLTRKGNIGTMTTQQMIQQERDIFIDLYRWYVDKFREIFQVDMEVLLYDSDLV